MAVHYDHAEASAHKVFDALLQAISRPGQVNTLPQAGLLQFIDTLIDLDTTTHNRVTDLQPAIVASRTRLVALEMAEHVFADDPQDATAIAEKLSIGDALYPDLGATIYVTCAHQGQKLRLSGPGIPQSTEVATALPAAFWQARNKACTYPAGFEVVIVEGNRLIAIPRSTKVEVL